MGMAASQVRLLQLTSRKNTIGYQLQDLSLQKTALTRDMRRVTKNYQESINNKVLKWSNNSGITYVDLSYKNLMKPGIANQNNPYLITNKDGRVVLDAKYSKYAEMISADGKSGGDWESNRVKILSELTGIPAEKIEQESTNKTNVQACKDKINAMQEEADKTLKKEPTVEKNSYNKFLEKAGPVYVGTTAYDLARLFNGNDKVNLGNAAVAKQNLKAIFDGMTANLTRYLRDEDIGYFKEACDSYIQTYDDYFGAKTEAAKSGLNNDTIGIYEHKGNYSINMKTVLTQLLEKYVSASKSSSNPAYKPNEYGGTDYYLYTRDKESTEWKEWYSKVEEYDKAYKEAYKELDAAVNADSTLLTAEEESSLSFYDKIFTAIADKGWVENLEVEDNEYLNNMLQNNQYFITTMEKQDDPNAKNEYSYREDIASNVKNVYSVNDPAANNDALTEYEYEKSIINEKETRIDVRMQNLQTEQSAINQMIKGIEKVENDNIDRTLGVFA